MFTIDQIKAAHSKVKSGADFPNYINDIKQLGVNSYEHYLTNGKIVYHGSGDFMLSGDPKWENRTIAEHSDAGSLKNELKIHQNGGTNYLTFCTLAAEMGVEKWIVDIRAMTCTYYDKKGNTLLIEQIPE